MDMKTTALTIGTKIKFENEICIVNNIFSEERFTVLNKMDQEYDMHISYDFTIEDKSVRVISKKRKAIYGHSVRYPYSYGVESYDITYTYIITINGETLRMKILNTSKSEMERLVKKVTSIDQLKKFSNISRYIIS
jgi:hypothetical protein